MSKNGFGRKAGVTQNTQTEEKVSPKFVRDTSDNKILQEIQVEDMTKYINESTVGVWDYDTPVYRIASNLENKFIKVVCNSDKTITADLKGVVAFKGRGKKIPDSCWLGLLNVDRKLNRLPLLEVEDFTVTEHQTLKMDEDKAFEQAKIQIHTGIKKIKQQYGLSKVKLLLGEGDTFRNLLPTCRPYKGTRQDTLRPLLLKKLRKWVIDNLDGEMAVSRDDGNMVECDDTIEYYSHLGYKHYRKNNWFSYVAISSDKDSMNSAKYLVNPDTHSGEHNPLRGKFKFPRAMLIEATDRSAGGLELVVKSNGKEVKGYGFMFLLYQAALGQDQADNYNCLSHLEQDLVFGDLSAYKVLKPCKTAKEALQATIDTFAELLPFGVQYTTHDGVEKDVPTMEYMNTYFLVAYMLRSDSDTMDFYKLCKAFKVDTSKIIDNNKLTPPKKCLADNKKVKEVTDDLRTEVGNLLTTEFKGYKALKKADLVDKLDRIKEHLGDIDGMFELLYEMRQEEK